MTPLFPQVDVALKSIESISQSVEDTEKTLAHQAESLSALKNDTSAVRDQVAGVKQELESKIETSVKLSGEGSTAGIEQMKLAAETLQAKISEVEGRFSVERAETGSQLDALRTQMQREAAEEAKKAAAAAAEDVKAAAAGAKPVDVKGEVNDLLAEKMAALKKEVDDNLSDQMKTQMRELLKGEAVADLEKRMHAALDDAMATMKDVVSKDLKAEYDPVRNEVEKIKEAMKNRLASDLVA